MWFCVLDVFADTPTGNHDGPPSTSFLRAERPDPSGARLRSARYARLRSASPRRGQDGGKSKLQKQFYTGQYETAFQFPQSWDGGGDFIVDMLFTKQGAIVGTTYTSYIDNVVLQQIPEPSTPALCFCGALLFAAWLTKPKLPDHTSFSR